MKYSIVLLLLISITACNGSTPEAGPEGIYITNFEHEYGRNEDTLVIMKINDKNIFQLSRHTGLVRKMDGKEFPKEVIIATWTLEFDPARQTLLELKEGKLLIWNNNTHSIRMGKREYKQISGS